MPTYTITQISFDDDTARIGFDGNLFIMTDNRGNELRLTLRAVLRCLAHAEHIGLVPALPDDFNEAIEPLRAR